MAARSRKKTPGVEATDKERLRVIQRDDGNVDIVYREIYEGGWFGEIAAFDKGRRTAAVHAMTFKEAVARAISQILQENVARRTTGKLKITQPGALKRLATQV